MSLNDLRKYQYSSGTLVKDREHSPARNLSEREREKKKVVVYGLLFFLSLLPRLVIRLFYCGCSSLPELSFKKRKKERSQDSSLSF